MAIATDIIGAGEAGTRLLLIEDQKRWETLVPIDDILSGMQRIVSLAPAKPMASGVCKPLPGVEVRLGGLMNYRRVARTSCWGTGATQRQVIRSLIRMDACKKDVERLYVGH